MGNDLVKSLLVSTGLPIEIAEKMFYRLLQKHKKSVDKLTLEDLRELLCDYMQDVLLEAKSKYE